MDVNEPAIHKTTIYKNCWFTFGYNIDELSDGVFDCIPSKQA